MYCWYCGKELRPWEKHRVVIAKGTTVPVCSDDRNCCPTGIYWKNKLIVPVKEKQLKLTALRKEKIKHGW